MLVSRDAKKVHLVSPVCAVSLVVTVKELRISRVTGNCVDVMIDSRLVESLVFGDQL